MQNFEMKSEFNPFWSKTEMTKYDTMAENTFQMHSKFLHSIYILLAGKLNAAIKFISA